MVAETMSAPPLPQPPPSLASESESESSSNSPRKFSLYVGDLDPQVTEDDIRETFRFFGPIASVRLCRDAFSGKSLCYGYVNFYSYSHASKALDCLNHDLLKGKSMRIMWSQRDPLPRKTGIGNLFVKNLDPEIDSAKLQEMFIKFGTILSCKVAEDNGKTLGFGFVQFHSNESAMAALTALHGNVIKGKKLYVSNFVCKSVREAKFTNLYVKNLGEDVTEDILKHEFSKFGKVSSHAIMKDGQGKSRGFGFVNFESPEEANKAVEALNGSLFGSKHLFVTRAQKKAEREELLKREHEKIFKSHIEQFKASNLYVSNLETSVDESKLREYFSACGKIISAKVMRYASGNSKGFGFVCFSTPQEAMKAMETLNGTLLKGKPLVLDLAKSKEDHQRPQQTHHAELYPRCLQSSHLTSLPNPIYPLHYNLTSYPPFYSLSNQCITYGRPSGNELSTHSLLNPSEMKNHQSDFSKYVPTTQAQRANSGSQAFQWNLWTCGTPTTRIWERENRQTGVVGSSGLVRVSANAGASVVAVPSMHSKTTPIQAAKVEWKCRQNAMIITKPTFPGQ